MTHTAVVMQAWIEVRSDDPEAVSALAVSRAGGVVERAPEVLERVRLFEITGTACSRERVEALLHGSSQFYNPHKERCVVRGSKDDPLPGPAGFEYIVVWERAGERRPAAERWWRHEAGECVEVREAVAWRARFAPGVEPTAAAHELARVRDARHGLLCNPWSQEFRCGVAAAAFPWIAPAPDAPGPRGPAAHPRTGGAA